MIKITCLTGRDLAFYSCWSQIEGARWNAAACVRSSSTVQGYKWSLNMSVRVPASREAMGLVQSWADPLSTVHSENRVQGWPWPRTSPLSQPESLTGLHCGESPHPGCPGWSSLSMSQLLGGAQYVLTGSCGQHIVCHLPVGAFGSLSHAQGWWLSLQLVGPHGGGGHSPAGTELAVQYISRADVWEAAGTLFLLFIQTSQSCLRMNTL